MKTTALKLSKIMLTPPIGAISAVLVCIGAAFADEAPQTYWVATNGSDAAEASGTEEAPFLTITNALAHAVDGDTIKVKAGKYDILLAPGGVDSFWATVTAAVTLEGVGGASEVILDGGQRNVTPFRISNDKAVLRGFTLRNFKSSSTWDKYYGGMIHLDAGMVADCVLTDSKCHYCGPVTMEGGIVTNCVFRNLEADDSNSWGGGLLMYKGSPLVTDCLFDTCKAKQGAAVYMNTAGTLRNCRMINCVGFDSNRAVSGTLSMVNGLVEDCIITNNVIAVNVTRTGAGGVNISGGTLRNCLVAGNKATSGTDGSVAGGILMRGASCSVESCTVCGNTLENPTFSGQGLYQQGGNLHNTIVALNGASGKFADFLNYVRKDGAGTVTYCCTYPKTDGEGNISEDPLFVEGRAGVLSVASDCINAGLDADWMVGAKDVFGNPRLYQTVDIGSHEVDLSEVPFTCTFVQDKDSGLSPVAVTFTAKIAGAPGEVTSIVWDFGDGTVDDTGSRSVTHVYDGYGRFNVKMTVTAGGETRECRGEDPIVSATDRTFVATDGGNVWPYATLETAARDLMDAVNAVTLETADSVGEVIVAPGRYTVPPAADKDTPWALVGIPVRIHSSDGPEVTFFDGGWDGKTQSSVCFAFYLNNARCSLEGVTIENLYSNTTYSKNLGAAVHLASGVLSNCVIRNVSCYFEGPLSVRTGTAVGCTVTNNVMRDGWTQGSVAVRGAGRVLDTLIADNRGKEGPGLYLVAANAVVSNCVIRGNVAEATTRGNYGGLVVSAGLLTDSVITGNTGHNGVVLLSGSGTVRNCLIAGNASECSASGGGVRMTGGTLESCTVVGNVARQSNLGHGLAQTGGTVRNCVIAYNGSDVFTDVANCEKTGGTMEYTCAYPAVAGTENWSVDPMFADRAAGDYSLSLASPLRDKGLEMPWMSGAFDVRGFARIIGDGPEPGCYETDPSQVPFSCDIQVDGAQVGILPFAVRLVGAAINPPGEVTAYEWDFGDGTTGSGETVTHTYGTTGKYTVKLVVRCGETAVEKTIPDLFSVGRDYAYLSTTGASVWPYDTEATAATNLQDALDAIILPDPESVGTVRVLPGVYRLKTVYQKLDDGHQVLLPQVSISRPIAVVSTGGPDVTVFDGGATPAKPSTGTLSEICRGFIMSHERASFSGFTVRGIRSSIADKTTSGGFELSAGTLSNCVFSNNLGYWAAPIGVKGSGVIRDCRIIGNWSIDSAAAGGGLLAAGNGQVIGCEFRGNRGVYGAAIWAHDSGVVISNCTFSGNTVDSPPFRGLGGATVELVAGLLTHSVLTGNTGYVAGAVSTWNGCSFNNMIKDANPVVRNCLIARNRAYGYNNTANGAGGVYLAAGSVENCTIADNVALAEGVCGQMKAERPAEAVGTVYELVNTILWGGDAADVLSPALTRLTNNEGDPLFRNAARGDYRLRQSSPCVDKGTSEGRAWMQAATDLAGQRRILGEEVDIGCLERVPTGLLLLVR